MITFASFSRATKVQAVEENLLEEDPDNEQETEVEAVEETEVSARKLVNI